MKKCILFFLIGLLQAQVCFSNDTVYLTLNDAIAISLNNNRNISILKEDINRFISNKKTAKARIRKKPEISLDFKDRDNSSNNDYGLSFTQPIEIGKQRSFRIKSADYDISIAMLNLQKEKLNINRNIKKYFIAINLLKEKRNNLEEILNMEKELEHWISIRAANGEISQTVSNTISISVNLTKISIMNINQKIQEKRKELEHEINSPISPEIEIENIISQFPDKISLSIIKSASLENNPDIKIAYTKYEQKKAEAEIIKAGQSISEIGLTVMHSREDNDNLTGAGLSVPLPLFNQKISRMNSLKSGIKKYKIEYIKTKENILSEIEKYFLSISAIKNQKQLFESNIISIAQDNLNKIKIRYMAGDIGLNEFQKAQNTFIKTKNEYIDLTKKYYDILCEIEFLSGKSFTTK